jgi:hypothetical protein
MKGAIFSLVSCATFVSERTAHSGLDGAEEKKKR